jgi:hypothetical protein
MKTIISHFYNEEYLLPWWLKHHKQFFDHGIMIDYHSTDNSVNIIKEICPTWEIVESKNLFFDSSDIDREVEEIEKRINGWRIVLNTTEFLVGDYKYIDNHDDNTILIGNYVFVDNKTENLDKDKPIYNQISFGYIEHDAAQAFQTINLGNRPNRVLHTGNLKYPISGGRHYDGKVSTKDLAIFYYAYLLKNEQIIKRKLQIQNKISEYELNFFKEVPHPNITNYEDFIFKILKHQYPKCEDLTLQIARLVNLQTNH